MKIDAIQISRFDALRLGPMLDQAVSEGQITGVEATKLRAELARARIVDPKAIPAAVVTMNSIVDLLDLENGEEETYTLVFPENADALEGKISVLAPLGTAILGCRVGDIINPEVPSGTRLLEVRNMIYQPEASKDFHL